MGRNGRRLGVVVDFRVGEVEEGVILKFEEGGLHDVRRVPGGISHAIGVRAVGFEFPMFIRVAGVEPIAEERGFEEDIFLGIKRVNRGYQTAREHERGSEQGQENS